MSANKAIAKATVIILIFSVLGKIVGFAREMIIAAFFGTTYRTDAFIIGLAGSDAIREIIAGSVLTAVFIPVYTASLCKDKKEDSSGMLNSVVTLLLIALAGAIVIGIPCAPFMVKLIAPEFDPATHQVAVQVTRIVFPSIMFMGLASLYGSLLNVHRSFLAPSLAQIVLNLGVIGGAAALSRTFGIQGLSWGFLAGAVLQILVLIPSLRANGITYRPQLDFSPHLRSMFALWVPLLATTAISIANDMAGRSLAAGLSAGSVAALGFASRIRETTWLLCAAPLGTAIFPFLSSYAAEGKEGEFEKLVSHAVRFTTFLALPLCLLMLLYSTPLIRVLFERGLFNGDSTRITASALKYYSLGAFFSTLNYVILRVYFSAHNTRLPLKSFIVGFVINISVGFLLRNYFQVGGIALARSLADAAMCVYLLAQMPRVVKGFSFKGMTAGLAKSSVTAAASIGISFAVYTQFPSGQEFISQLLHISVAWGSGLLLYVGINKMLKSEEVSAVWALLRKRLPA